jgi:hypothetical protein
MVPDEFVFVSAFSVVCLTAVFLAFAKKDPKKLLL